MAKTSTKPKPMILGADGEPLSDNLPATVETRPPAVAGYQSELITLIERMAVNKDVDADKLEKLLGMQERILDRNAHAAFDAAFVEMQAELPTITRDGRIVVREKDSQGKRTGEKTQDTPYAKWETIVEAVRPILHKHGFGISHRSEKTPDGVLLRVTAVLRGHGWTDDRCYFDLAADTTGSKNNAQGWASSLSYAKRHTACAVLGIVTRGEDDDGRSSGRPVVIGDGLTDEQTTQLIELCEAVQCPKEKFVDHMNKTRPKGHPEATGIALLPTTRFDEAVAALRSYEQKRKEREGK